MDEQSSAAWRIGIERNLSELKGGAKLKLALWTSSLMILASVLTAFVTVKIDKGDKAELNALLLHTEERLEEFRQEASGAKESAAEARRVMATLESVKTIDTKLDDVMDKLVRADVGIIPKAQWAADQAEAHEKVARTAAVALDELRSNSEDIRTTIDELEQVLSSAEQAAASARKQVQQLIAESTIDFDFKLGELKDKLRVVLGPRRAREAGVLQVASSPGFVAANLVLDVDRPKKIKKSESAQGICSYVGPEHLVRKKGGLKTESRIDLKSRARQASVLLPVARGDSWLIAGCPGTNPASSEIEVYWSEMSLELSSEFER